MPANKPEECDELFEKYVNAGDLESLVALYEADATLVAGPGQMATGTDAIRAALKPMIDSGMKVKLNVTQTIVAGDIAVTYNEWTGVLKMPGADEVKMSGKAMEICHRQPDGNWRFAIDDPYARG
jgi:uncharacterized protein (TIGR02246 family)